MNFLDIFVYFSKYYIRQLNFYESELQAQSMLVIS